MGAMRITQRMMADRVLWNINFQQNTILQLQTHLATGRRVNAPSDDPIDARRAVNTRTAIAQSEQYITNLASAESFLRETATTVQTVNSNVQRLRELTIQGANGTYSQTELDNIAQEVDQILQAMVNTANHQVGNRYAFGGTRTSARPYVETVNASGTITAVTYVGNDEYIEVATGDGVTLAMNEPGSRVFGNPQDLFQMVIDIRDNLLAGDQTSLQNARLTELESARAQLGQTLARVGARQNRGLRATVEIEDFVLSSQELLSDTIDADFAETIINLNAQSNAFQAALTAGARVIQPSLLDFIR